MSVLRATFSPMMMALRRLHTRIVLNICFLASFLRRLFAKASQWAIIRLVRASGIAFPTGLACLACQGIWGHEDVQVAR